MAHLLLQSERVLYQCSCGNRKPLCRVYFCRHCMKLRCGDCVSHEVDSHYCSTCLENMPSAEARLKKNRCANCFDCPSCKHMLSTRATSIQVPNPEDPNKTIPKKVYYLACGFCRWSSRDVGLKDQNVASGGWQELENPHAKRINSLLEHYRAMAQQEKLDKERKKFTRKRGYLHFTDKYGLTAVVARKRAGLPPIGTLSLKDDDVKPLELIPAESTDLVEQLPKEFLTKPVDLVTVCGMSQRLLQPEYQPNYTMQLYPRHKHLLIKRSQRCRECEHNLSKPEFNPASIKFKIQLSAYYHIPEMRIKPVTTFMYGKVIDVVLTLTNPTQHAMHITLSSTDTEDDTITAKIELTSTELLVSPRDDAAEFDDITENLVHKDDPKIVAFRKANKLGVHAKVTPMQERGEVVGSLMLRYDYVNTMPQVQGEQKEPQLNWLEHRLFINFGDVQAVQ